MIAVKFGVNFVWGISLYLGDPHDGVANYGALYLLFVVLVFPAVEVVAMALHIWQDDGGGPPRDARQAHARGGGALLLAFAIGVASVLSATMGVLALMFIFVCAGGVCVLHKWRENKFYLPPRYRKAVIGLGVFCVLVGGACALADEAQAFLTSSVSWFIIAVFLLGFSARTELPRRVSAAPNTPHYAPTTLFPVFKYNPAQGTFMTSNKAPGCVLAALVMTFLWGVWSSLLVKPSFVGCWCASVAVILGALYVQMRVGAARRELLELAGTVADDKLCISYIDAVDRELNDGTAHDIEAQPTRCGGGAAVDGAADDAAKKALSADDVQRARDIDNEARKEHDRLDDEVLKHSASGGQLAAWSPFSPLPLVGISPAPAAGAARRSLRRSSRASRTTRRRSNPRRCSGGSTRSSPCSPCRRRRRLARRSKPSSAPSFASNSSGTATTSAWRSPSSTRRTARR